jgi:hypothetical protein
MPAPLNGGACAAPPCFKRRSRVYSLGRWPEDVLSWRSNTNQHMRGRLWHASSDLMHGGFRCATLQLCINRLKAKFPSSQRVRKLEAMLHEAEGHFDAALAIYTEMLEDNPVDQVRRCTVLYGTVLSVVAGRGPAACVAWPHAAPW